MQLHAVLLVGWLLAQTLPTAVDPPGGNTIVTPPETPGGHTTTSSGNVTVNITPPPPDPAALQASTNFAIDSWEYQHVQAPVDWANALLKGKNIWTTTPPDWFDNFTVAGMRNSAKTAAIGLFVLGMLWTGAELIWGSASGTTQAMQLLPLAITGLLLAASADTITHRSIDLNNWLCSKLGEITLVDFTGKGLELPPLPDAPATNVNVGPLPDAAFVEHLLTSLIYAIFLLILELKLFFRMAVLTVGDVVLPISGVLWGFRITRGYAMRLLSLFFGWLFGQPLVVVCLAISSSLLGFMGIDDAQSVIVKVGVLFAAIKLVSVFANSLGGGGLFGVAGLLFLLRRTQSLTRRASSGGSSGAPASSAAPAASQPRAAVQPGGAGGGTGSGTAATGRPWRPAMGTA